MNPLREIRFEEEIEQYLLKTCYIKGDPKHYDKSLAMDTTILLDFIKSSQPTQWQKLVSKYGANTEAEFLKRLHNELMKKGLIYLLRHGFRDAPANFRLMYNAPVSNLNQTVVADYNKNVLSITRQVYYSNKNQNSVDIVLFINGLPFATLELKNGINEKTADAVRQYKHTRDPQELLFNAKARAVVHFAVDPYEVEMTTKLQGGMTIFLPFNKGHNHGKGNPHNPNRASTAYLWETILQKDSIIEILQNFIHVDEEKIIFPRYHQLDVVRTIVEDVRAHGTGKNYLIQHSAGSGKSNSIAWLAYHLQSLHNKEDQNIFDSVIVVTDRTVLDSQLQDTIYQFDHEPGLVCKIDKGAKSLEEAILGGKKIIITTLQKFPFTDTVTIVNKVKGKRFAVIIDEAHSSQSGASHLKMKETLGSPKEEVLQRIAQESAQLEDQENDIQSQITEEIAKQGVLPNLSFFAFTATPKPKTIETFGVNNRPFHEYSMKQAIEEGFILDVLQNYNTYTTYFKLVKNIADDPMYKTKRAKKALAKYLNLHPHNLAQKTEIIIEHFNDVTKDKIRGQAKAMLVTSSRSHAVHYYYALKNYIAAHNYDIKVLVAFSGSLMDNGQEVTEVQLNKIKEDEVKKKFHDEYQILIVAEKYQTGFDEPLLHTMFVDKPLDGVKAVQTLSRVNRTNPFKKDTFILDFVNTAEGIQEAFDPFYKTTEIDQPTDYNLVYDIKNHLDSFQIYWNTEVDNFAKDFYKSKNKEREFGKLISHVVPAIDRYNAKPKEEQDEFKEQLIKFVRTYSFITNLVSLEDPDLHKFHAYSKVLSNKIRSPHGEGSLIIDDEVKLEYYRIQSVFSGAIQVEGDSILANSKFSGKDKAPELEDQLSEIIKTMNDRFGTEFAPEDVVFAEMTINALARDEDVMQMAKNNSPDHLALPLRKKVEEILSQSYDQHGSFVEKTFETEERLVGFVLLLAQTLCTISKDKAGKK